jgi:hypothetical protein
MNMRTLEKYSTWFPGSRAEWERIPFETREEMAFTGTGCLLAWPTWDAPTNCLHIKCRVRRGEVPPICETNSTLLAELHSGWLRFDMDDPGARLRKAKLCRIVRRLARETKNYDAWSIAWNYMVGDALA